MATAPDTPGKPRRPWWARRWVYGVVILVVAVAAVYGWAHQGASKLWTFQAGSAPEITLASSCKPAGSGGLALPDGRPCARIVLPAGKGHALSGRLLMVDVLVGPTTAWQYLLSRLGLLDVFSRAAELVPASQVLGGAPASQFQCQDTEEMAGAQSAAPVAALRTLGYDIPAHYDGSLVVVVQPHGPAERAGVRCGDSVVAFAGTRTPTADALIRAVESHHPGDTVSITVRRNATEHTYRVTLGKRPGAPKDGFLGIGTSDNPKYDLPFPVDIRVGNIGGPSAGLAMTLAILDGLSGGHLTGGHTVAVTGTIAPSGAVGPVGGVAQKTVAVQRAGATLFLVPATEVATARKEARPGMKVEGVTSLREAIADLKAIGGTIPAPARS